MFTRRVASNVARELRRAGSRSVSRALIAGVDRKNWGSDGQDGGRFASGTVAAWVSGAGVLGYGLWNSADQYRLDTMEVFGAEEIMQHDQPEDCWIVVQNKIYDLSEFLRLHPGAAAILMPYMGKDATGAFSNVKSPERFIAKLTNNKLVGIMITDFEHSEDVEPLEDEDIQRLFNIINKPDISDMFSLLDFEYVAKKILPKVSYTYYATGVDDEFSIRENHYAYNRVFFRPRVLTDTANVDLGSELLGCKVSVPIYITAFAGSKLAHPLAEKNLRAAAYREGIVQMVPTQLSMPFDLFMKEVPDDQEQWAQLHFYSDAEIKNSIKHFKRFEGQPNIKGVFVNADIAALGNREKDSKIRLQYDNDGAMKQFTNHEVARPTLTWEDIKRFKEETKLPLCLKGVQNAEDVVMAAELGLSGVIISNHGGRQLDFSQPSLEVLAESTSMLKAKGLDGKMDLFIDGGIKRGSDVIKALCLGAKGVGLGRPFLYSMAGYGEEGVVKTIQILKAEMERDMKLLGVSKIQDLNESYLDVTGLKYRSNGSDDRLYNGAYEPVYFPKFKNE